MIKNNHKKIYKISADLLPVDIEIIKVYMQGAVYAFCNIKKDEPFSARILFGGDNGNWNGTPMQKLYDYYIKEGKSKEEAYKSAAIDAGRLLKSLLDGDNYRTFEIVGKDTGTLYKLA
ncbi:MAG: hypothetical protein J1E05_02115 [Eubacterium sp.]|nr:hypothetical protein [Eubacterium sp.]